MALNPNQHGALKMNRIAFAVMLLVLTLPNLASARQLYTGASIAPEKFVQTAGQANTTEIRASQIAAQKTSNPEIKDFAQLMIKDHSKAGDELAAIAQKKNLKVPEGVDGKVQAMLDRLQSQSGARFDRSYTKMMLKDHRKAVKFFQWYANNGTDAELKQFAKQTLPTLQEHLRKAEDLERSRPAEASTRG
jgi:putative membrane protein